MKCLRFGQTGEHSCPRFEGTAKLFRGLGPVQGVPANAPRRDGRAGDEIGSGRRGGTPIGGLRSGPDSFSQSARGFGSGRFFVRHILRGQARSTTRAKQPTITRAAPARLSAETQASLVAPLVSTSSTSRMLRPFNPARRCGDTSIAPLRARRRAARPNPPSIGVAFLRTSASTHNSASLASATALARSAA